MSAPDETVDRLIDFKELKSLVPYSRMHIDRLERAGRFPKRVHIGPMRVAWSISEVSSWIEARKAERDTSADNAETDDAPALAT